MDNAASQSSFDTRDLPPLLRGPLWGEYLRRWMGEFAYSTLGETPLNVRGSVRSTELDRLRLAELSGSGCLITRDARLIRSAPSDIISLCIILRGEAVVYSTGGGTVLKAGDAILYDLDVPTVCGLQDGFAELEILVPRELYAERYRNERLHDPKILRSVAGGPVSSHVAAAVRISRIPFDADAVQEATEAAFDLFDTIVAGTPRSTVGYWLSAREHIRRNLHDPRLSVRQVAFAVGISERHLSRVFAERSTTVASTILEERLDRARELLADPRRHALQISEIATSVGYATSAQFGRAFRRRFGCTAGEVRRHYTHRDSASQP